MMDAHAGADIGPLLRNAAGRGLSSPPPEKCGEGVRPNSGRPKAPPAQHERQVRSSFRPRGICVASAFSALPGQERPPCAGMKRRRRTGPPTTLLAHSPFPLSFAPLALLLLLLSGAAAQAPAIPAAFAACALRCIRAAANGAGCTFVNLYVPDPSCACGAASGADFGARLTECFDGDLTCTDAVAVRQWWRNTLCAVATSGGRKTTTKRAASPTPDPGDPLFPTITPTLSEEPAPVPTTKRKVKTTKRVKTTRKIKTTRKKTTTTTEEPTPTENPGDPTVPTVDPGGSSESPEATFVISVDSETTDGTTETSSTGRRTSRTTTTRTFSVSTTKRALPSWADPSGPFPFEPSSAGHRTRAWGLAWAAEALGNAPIAMRAAAALAVAAWVRRGDAVAWAGAAMVLAAALGAE
ncbi:hypothetical protein DFJ74DRAFT_496610 [Hyaloraphidium curvatum]|nr:hypothetical protein DFJ74DRAFT_496610 [Hyaloraphidium curvatum]